MYTYIQVQPSARREGFTTIPDAPPSDWERQSLTYHGEGRPLLLKEIPY